MMTWFIHSCWHLMREKFMERLDSRWGVVRAAFLAAIASLVLVANGFAAALVQDLKGDVRTDAAAAVAKGQRVLTGATLNTGAGSQATLLFDDGQQVVLNENTQFTITDYRFAKENPQSDRSFFSLARGAARVVTGALAQRSRSAFEFRTPTSTIGIRGTDFMLAVVEQPSYLSVLQGEIAATNAAGTVTFGAGSFGMISAANVLAVSIAAVALPAAVASAFSSLGAAAVGAGAAAGASSAVGGAAGGIGLGAVAAVGAVGVAAAAAASGGGGGNAANTTPSGSPSAFAGSYHGTYTQSVSGTVSGGSVTDSCTGTWIGTTDSAGVFTGTLTVTSCTIPSVYRPTGNYAIGATIDATGNVTPMTGSASSSGLTASCTGSGTATATTGGYTQQCTVTGTLTPCTGNCAVNVITIETYTGTRP
jgi:hypothetical protein